MKERDMREKKEIEELSDFFYSVDRTSYLGGPIRVMNYNALALACYDAGYRKLPENIGEFSDGYHTFNELYHHRAVLFSVICNMFPDKAWKSKLHDTGDMFDGMFIVGIETEQGQATYHYDVDPYWDMFKVKELEKAPKWDGHSPSVAIDRIGNLTKGYRKQSGWISAENPPDEYRDEYGELIPFLVCCQGTVYPFRAMYDGTNWGDGIGVLKVTHWMPLPEPPKGE